MIQITDSQKYSKIIQPLYKEFKKEFNLSTMEELLLFLGFGNLLRENGSVYDYLIEEAIRKYRLKHTLKNI